MFRNQPKCITLTKEGQTPNRKVRKFPRNTNYLQECKLIKNKKSKNTNYGKHKTKSLKTDRILVLRQEDIKERCIKFIKEDLQTNDTTSVNSNTK